MTDRADPLPEPLLERPFHIREAGELGVSRSRLRAKDLDHPHPGVRVARRATPPTVVQRARDYAAKMPEGGFFSHTTAAVLHGMWLPLERERSTILDVSVVKPVRAPRDRGVRGHHLVLRPGLVRAVLGLPVAGAVDTWCQLATQLAFEDLVAAGEGLLTPDHSDAADRLERLRAAAADPHRPNAAKLRRAAAALRTGSRSRKETLLRLLLVKAGLPEPEINLEFQDARGRRVAESDLAYRAARVLLEYEGDHHRTDKQRFRKDLAKYEVLQDLGWRVVRVTEEDLQRPAALIERVRRLLGG